MNVLPLYPHDAFGFPTGLLLGTLIGFAFGFVLERAGFGNAKNLAAQFYLKSDEPEDALAVPAELAARASQGRWPTRPTSTPSKPSGARGSVRRGPPPG